MTELVSRDPSRAAEGQSGGPRIRPPPPTVARRRGGDGRGMIWIGMLAVGVGLGAAAYQWVPGLDIQFDDWLSAILG